MSKIAILGAGVGGLSAAWDLCRAGHQVTIFESAATAGGLSGGFKEPGWEWSLEHYYHHWFQTDADMLGLIAELGWSDQVVFPRPKTVVYYKDRFYPLDSPLAALTFPGFTFLDMVRFGLVTVYLRYFAHWQPLEKFTAVDWLRRAYGERLFVSQFEPLLQGKFGPYYQEVNMAWFWARIKARTTRLGTFQGGFQAFIDRFVTRLKEMQVTFRMQTPVEKITPLDKGGLELVLAGASTEKFDQVLVTTSPALLARLVPTLPEDYLSGLLNLHSMGAVVLILALKHSLSEEGYYWFNIPKSAGYPFLALVEHTNFLKSEYFGGDHIVYCGDYLDPQHVYFAMSKEELLQEFLPALKRFNPAFEPGWVRASWLSRTTYAQPVPLLNHSTNIPSLATPIPGLYFASMSQVYPWDRGTNFAVQVARKAARLMLSRDTSKT